MFFNAMLSRLAKKGHVLTTVRTLGIPFRAFPGAMGGPGFQKKIIIFGPYRIGLAFWILQKQSGQNFSKIGKLGKMGEFSVLN